MSKIRTVSEIPVMDDDGSLIFIRELAAPSSLVSSLPTEGMANGSVCMLTDAPGFIKFDEDAGWGEPE